MYQTYLKYRDNSFMYFPCIELIPYLKAVDISTKKQLMFPLKRTAMMQISKIMGVNY